MEITKKKMATLARGQMKLGEDVRKENSAVICQMDTQ